MNVTVLGKEGAQKLKYADRIEEKTNGFCATFNVPPQYWDLAKDKRPASARVWKTKVYRRTDRPQWKLSIWGDTYDTCLSNCVSLATLLGLPLC